MNNDDFTKKCIKGLFMDIKNDETFFPIIH